MALETAKPTKCVSRWERDLNRTFDQADLSSIWQATKSSSPNIAPLETNYKVLTRWYLVPSRIHKLLPQYLPHCFCGYNETGTLLYIWWDCPIAQAFWSDFFNLNKTICHPPTTQTNSGSPEQQTHVLDLSPVQTTTIHHYFRQADHSESLEDTYLECTSSTKQNRPCYDPRYDRGNIPGQNPEIHETLKPLGNPFLTSWF